jgi:hypothetical protein
VASSPFLITVFAPFSLIDDRSDAMSVPIVRNLAIDRRSPMMTVSAITMIGTVAWME